MKQKKTLKDKVVLQTKVEEIEGNGGGEEKVGPKVNYLYSHVLGHRPRKLS